MRFSEACFSWTSVRHYSSQILLGRFPTALSRMQKDTNSRIWLVAAVLYNTARSWHIRYEFFSKRCAFTTEYPFLSRVEPFLPLRALWFRWKDDVTDYLVSCFEQKSFVRTHSSNFNPKLRGYSRSAQFISQLLWADCTYRRSTKTTDC